MGLVETLYALFTKLAPWVKKAAIAKTASLSATVLPKVTLLEGAFLGKKIALTSHHIGTTLIELGLEHLLNRTQRFSCSPAGSDTIRYTGTGSSRDLLRGLGLSSSLDVTLPSIDTSWTPPIPDLSTTTTNPLSRIRERIASKDLKYCKICFSFYEGSNHRCTPQKCYQCGEGYYYGIPHYCKTNYCKRCQILYYGSSHTCISQYCSECGQDYYEPYHSHICNMLAKHRRS